MIPRPTVFLLTSVLLAGCAGSSPSAPDAMDPSPGFALRGETVSALDGRPISGVRVSVGSQTVVSDVNGRFDVSPLREGSETITLSGPAVIERRKTVTIPATDAGREALIPASFDLTAFDEMFRGTGRLQRWTSAPGLVVLGKVMQYDSFAAQDQYRATSESLTDAETALLIEQLSEGLALLTGNAFAAFSSIDIESPAPGAMVGVLRSGRIVIGRYRGVQALANTVGFARWGTEGTAEVTAGAIYLDRNFDASSESRRLLRIHELGHALGYLHVTARASIMNPAIGPEPTQFDRQAAIIAFQRMPGNQSPDSDLVSAPRPPGIFGSQPGRTVWAAPLVCGSAVDSRQSTVSSRQSAVGSRQSAVGSR